MWGLYHETDPPSAVEEAVYCNFTSPFEKNLVVSGANALRVFRLNPHIAKKKDKDAGGEGVERDTQMECIFQFKFLAPISSIAAARLPRFSRDVLLLGFEEAKLSVVAYDPSNHYLTTISLHSFEDEMLRGGFTRDFPLPIIRTDPESRCGAMLFYGRHLGIVPLVGRGADALLDEPDFLSPSVRGRISDDKVPRATLYSYVITLESLDERLQNVSDICFLQGYYEPTLLMLYEPMQTTTGRTAIRQDTYCILAVSLNVKDRVHAVIWTVNLLPFDCFRCLPVPKPVGGVIILTANSLIYLNQSVPAYGISVNSCMRGVTSFPLRDQESKKIVLDCSAADFILPNTLVLVLKSGDLYVLTMLVDNTNVLKGMQLDKSSSAGAPTVACACDSGYFFVGSRLADSIMFKYRETDSFAVQVTSEPGQKAEEPTRADPTDDLAIYGEVVAVTTVENMRVIEYSFEQCDRIFNMGPCRHMALGIPTKVPAPLQTQQMDPIVDMVFASGHNESGSIVLLQKQLRPQILTSSPIPGAVQLWTVGKWRTDTQSSLVQDAEDEASLPGSQRFLLVSKEVVTMVLELGDEISEMESSGFAMEQRTVAAGDLGQGRFIVQVCPMLVVLLEGSHQIQNLPLDISFPVAQASILDPYVVILTENGEVVVLELRVEEESAEVGLHLIPINFHQAPATAISVYKDLSGVFRLSSGVKYGDKKPAVKPEGATKEPSVDPVVPTPAVGEVSNILKSEAGASLTVDDEDALLYGGPDEFRSSHDKGRYKSEPVPVESVFDPMDIYFEGVVPTSVMKPPKEVLPTYWVAVARENGFLEIFSLPDFKLVYLAKKFPCLFDTVHDTDPMSFQTDQERPDEHYDIVKEISLIGLGPNRSRPYLFAVCSDELVIYEVFPFDDSFAGHLSIRFRKCPHEAILRNYRSAKGKKRTYRGSQVEASVSAEESQINSRFFPRLLVPFEEIGSDGEDYYGVFVAGLYPYWVLVLATGQLRVHPMSFDGPIRSLSPFHNLNCQKGFLYLSGEDSMMRICQMDSEMNLNYSAPVKRVELGRTVHFISYLLESQIYAVTTSENVPCKKIVSLIGDDKQFESLEKQDEPNFIFPTIPQFKVQLLVPDTFEPIPGAGELEMEEFEHVTVMKEVKLNSEGTISGFQSYLAVGTLYNYGEEVLGRGRIFIVEIIEVVPEPGQPESTKNKMKTIYCKEQKGPVTSLCGCQGYLLMGMGQKVSSPTIVCLNSEYQEYQLEAVVYIWQLKDGDLQGISFIDMQCYIHQMVSLRNLAMVADAYNSIALLRYQEYCKALSIASRDFRLTPVQANPMGIEYLIDNKQLGFLMADEEKNIHIMTYQPEDKLSLGGQKLIPKGEINVGSRIAHFVRIQGHVSDPIIENKNTGVKRHMNLFGSLDGSVGFILPISERTYRRLHTLQASLSASLPHLGGLNPRGARNVRGLRGHHQASQQTKSCIVDGDVVFRYLNLSGPEKQEVAKRIGSTKEQLLDDLLEVARSSTHF